MKPRTVVALLLFAVTFCQFVASELIVHSPDSIAGTYTAFPIIYQNNFHNFTIDGQIVFRNATDVIDKIVLVPWFRGTYLSQIRTEQNRGAKAVIISVQQGIYPGQANYILDSADVADVTLSAWQISLADYNTIAVALTTLQNNTLDVTLTPIGLNPWKEWNESFMIFFQVFITAFSVANIAFAIYRLAKHVKETGCRRKLPQVCLSLIIAGNILRVVHIAIDPVVSRAIYPVAMQQLVLSISHPFSLSVTILITFYWHDVMHGMSLNVNQMLGKFKIPFIIIIAILFGIEIGFGITRALTVLTGVFITTMITVNSAIYSAVCLAFAIFFFVTAGKLSKVLRGKNRKDSKRGRTLGTITSHILVVGGCLVSHVVIFIILANTTVSYQPRAYGTVWFSSYLVLCIQDLFQSLVLVPKAMKKTSSKSSNKISTTTERV